MSDLTNYTERTDQQLALGAGVQAGNQIEAMRRLRVAVEEQTRAAERQSRASMLFTRVIIALMVVQVFVAGAQIAIALVKAGQ